MRTNCYVIPLLPLGSAVAASRPSRLHCCDVNQLPQLRNSEQALLHCQHWAIDFCQRSTLASPAKHSTSAQDIGVAHSTLAWYTAPAERKDSTSRFLAPNSLARWAVWPRGAAARLRVLATRVPRVMERSDGGRTKPVNQRRILRRLSDLYLVALEPRLRLV